MIFLIVKQKLINVIHYKGVTQPGLNYNLVQETKRNYSLRMRYNYLIVTIPSLLYFAQILAI